LAHAQQEQRGQTSYMKVDSTEPFAAFMARMAAAKPGIAKEHNALLSERYDLSDRPAKGVAMDRGKPLQEGVRVKLPAGMTWVMSRRVSWSRSPITTNCSTACSRRGSSKGCGCC